jgi:predicted lipoprotein
MLLASGCATPGPAPQRLDPALGQRVLHEYVQPATRQLLTASRLLHEDLQAYCALPTDGATRAQVEARLAALVDAWAHVELLRFGPLIESNRLENFFFWPDPRGVVQRQVRALLAAADAALLEPLTLRQQSAAVQGLSGLEYALFADDAVQAIARGDAPGRYRCDFTLAVAANLARLASELEDGWKTAAPFAEELAKPGPRRTVYRSVTEVATEILKAISTALHSERDQKLLPGLGESPEQARGTLLPLHRSAMSSRYLAAHTQALLEFYAASGLGAMLPADAAWVDTNLRGELKRIVDDLTALRLPPAQAVTDAEERDLLVHAALLLANARAIVDEYLAPALGVSLGFNSLDGD